MDTTKEAAKPKNLGITFPYPGTFFKMPVVILDSGQSVAESVFVERFRQHTFQYIQKYAKNFNTPTVWILYPGGNPDKYGAYPCSEYDKWEIRDLTKNKYLKPEGFFASVAGFEEGCHWMKIKAPWREWNSKNKRACVVYLNPLEKDLKWMGRNWQNFKKPFNIPSLMLGAPPNRKLPRFIEQMSNMIWTFDRDARNNLAKAFHETFAKRLRWETWWKTQYEFKNEAVAAPDWCDMSVRRFPNVAENWAEALGLKVYHPKNNGSWQDFLFGTDAKMYILATTKESVPFDAMIALARGCTLVAPDVPLFQRLHGKKKLYPAKMVGDRIIWSQTEVTHFLKGQKHGLANST